MLAFRPTKKQWRHLGRVAYPRKCFDAAYKRWKAGELIIGNPADFTKAVLKGNIGAPMVLSKEYEDVPDSDTARAILEAHLFIKPIKLWKEKELKALDEEIKALMGENSGVVAIDAATGKPIRER